MENQIALETRLFKWIEETFGKNRHGDGIQFTKNASEKAAPNVGLKFIHTEIKLSLHRIMAEDKKYSIDEKAKKWKKELDEITDNSVVQFNASLERVVIGQDGMFNNLQSIQISISIHHKQKSGVTLLTAQGGPVPH